MQFSNLPSVDSVLSKQEVAAAAKSFDRNWIVDLVRDELALAREYIRKGGVSPNADDVAEQVCNLSLIHI